jgi:uncharacterized membrane protein YhaH (DUF805 family)
MPFKHIALSFEGRIGRLAYIGYSLAISIVLLIALLIAVEVVMFGNKSHDTIVILLGGLICLPCIVLLIWTSLALQVKRLHDVNLSGHYLWLLVGIGAVIGICKSFIPDIAIFQGIFQIAIIAFFWAFPGTIGGNKYGYLIK